MRAYLAEFLSDKRVVPLPRLLWLPVLYGAVLPRRSKEAAEKYWQIWLPEGSPLRVYTAPQAELLADKLHVPVAYAMRYGEPSIKATLPRLEDPVVVPLYPQYADSTTGSGRVNDTSSGPASSGTAHPHAPMAEASSAARMSSTAATPSAPATASPQ